MPEYRLYRLHPDYGHIIGSDDLDAADDSTALHAIRKRGYSVPIELWTGTRKVGHVEIQPQAASSWPGLDES